MARRTARIISVFNLLMLLSAGALGIRFGAPHLLEKWIWILLFRSLNCILYGGLAILIIHRHARHTVGGLAFFGVTAYLRRGTGAQAR
jgi:hypothetical protein